MVSAHTAALLHCPFRAGNGILILLENTQSFLQSVDFAPAQILGHHASFEQKLVSKDAAEMAKLDVGE